MRTGDVPTYGHGSSDSLTAQTLTPAAGTAQIPKPKEAGKVATNVPKGIDYSSRDHTPTEAMRLVGNETDAQKANGPP